MQSKKNGPGSRSPFQGTPPTTARHLFTHLTLSIVLFVLQDNFISEVLACLWSMLLSPNGYVAISELQTQISHLVCAIFN